MFLAFKWEMFSISFPNPRANTLVPCCTSATVHVYFLENLWDNVKAKHPLPALTSNTVCLQRGGSRDIQLWKFITQYEVILGMPLGKGISVAHFFSLSEPPQETWKGSFLSVIWHHPSLYGADDPSKLLLQKAGFPSMLISAQGWSQEEKLLSSPYGEAGQRKWSHSKIMNSWKLLKGCKNTSKTARIGEGTQRVLWKGWVEQTLGKLWQLRSRKMCYFDMGAWLFLRTALAGQEPL